MMRRDVGGEDLRGHIHVVADVVGIEHFIETQAAKIGLVQIE